MKILRGENLVGNPPLLIINWNHERDHLFTFMNNNMNLLLLLNVICATVFREICMEKVSIRITK